MCVITIAIHTGSVWLVCMGLAQIVLAIPLSYAVYRFIFGLEFFSMLNLIGLFISVALGADDIFVSTNKWKNARLKNPEKSTEEIAVIALPDSATTMLLTTLTTIFLLRVFHLLHKFIALLSFADLWWLHLTKF